MAINEKLHTKVKEKNINCKLQINGIFDEQKSGMRQCLNVSMEAIKSARKHITHTYIYNKNENFHSQFMQTNENGCK